MPRKELTFSRGLITDTIGVDGALLQLDDAYIDRLGEIRKRGGKPTVNTDQVGGFSTAGYVICLPGAYSTGGVRYFAMQEANVTDNYWAAGSRNLGTGNVTLSTYRNQSDDLAEALNSLTIGRQEVLFCDRDSHQIFAWSGADKAQYTTGTVAMTSGSAIVTGSGTSWSANVAKGMYLSVSDADVGDGAVWYRIESVDSNTQVTLENAVTFSNTVSGANYKISSYAPNMANMLATNIVMHQGRLFATGASDTPGSSTTTRYRLRWSALPSEASPAATYRSGTCYWDTSAFLDVAEGVGGRETGAVSYRGSLLLFREHAVIAVRGAFATDGTDLGASVEILSQGCGHDNATVYSEPVITPLGVVFADTQGAWVTDGSGIRSLTDGVISSLWRSTGAGQSGYGIQVLDLGTRVGFVHHSATLNTPTNTFILDISSGSWSTQSTARGFVNVTREYNDSFVGMSSSNGALYDWKGDLTTANKQDGVGSGPLMKVTTHPIPMNVSSPLLGHVGVTVLNSM